jgi:hypothetical protein
MLQLKASGPIGALAPDALAEARRNFNEGHPLVLRNFLDPALLKLAQEQLPSVQFVHGEHRDKAEPSKLAMMLTFLVSGRDMIDLVSSLVHRPIRSAYGTIYKFLPGNETEWHCDDTMLAAAVGINIGLAPYDGGGFEMKKVQTETILAKADYSVPGDALLFPINPQLVHRTRLIEGTQPKVIFAGLFDPGGRGRGFTAEPLPIVAN